MMKNKLEQIRQLLINTATENAKNDREFIDQLITEYYTLTFSKYTDDDLIESAEYHFGIEVELEPTLN